MLKERLHTFLEEAGTAASAELLAQEVLGLAGARGAVAEKVVGAAIDGDPRFARTARGEWLLKPRGKGAQLAQATFVCFGLREGLDAGGNEHIELAARRVQPDGSDAIFPAVRAARSEAADLLRSFAAFSEGAIPVAFRLPGLQKAVNRLTRIALGQSVLTGGLCLFRLGRRFFPDATLPDLNALASAMELAYVADRGAEGDVSLQAEILLRLLDCCSEVGLLTLEAVMADLYPDPVPVRFEAYAFDETYLRELPEAPGAYIMRDRDGKVIYVGKAVNLRNRVGSYFARRTERPEKTQRILDRIWSMEVETVGSELEALLLEARLIALCQPEFNTQVVVHERQANLGPVRRWVLVLPSVEPDCVELFCMVDAGPLAQLRVRQDLCDWDGVSEALRRHFFELVAPQGKLSEPERAEREIALSWLAQHRDAVNIVDMEAVGSGAEALRMVREYAQQCEIENWEKISWRV